MTLKSALLLHLLLFPCASFGEVFVLGSSYSWDARPPLLEESHFWHIDCGKSLLYIWNNPLIPCLGGSTPWSNALARDSYDYVSFQPVPDNASSTLETDVATISGWMAMQPRAIGVIHPTWGWPAVFHTLFHDPAADQSLTNYSRDYTYRLIDELRRANPGRLFLTDRGNEMLDAIYHDVEAGRGPLGDFSELFRDDAGHLSPVGSYLMHNALRQAFGQPVGVNAAAIGIDPQRQAYLDAVVRAFAPASLVCSDGADNDLDLLVDSADPGCTASGDGAEGVRLLASESRCAAEQTSRGAQFCSAAFACWSRHVANPQKDASGARLDACLAKVEGKYASGHAKALREALPPEASCRLEAPVEAFVEEAFLGPLASISDPILAGWTGLASRDENHLRAEVLGAAGELCALRLEAESAYAGDADGARLGSERTQARERFASQLSRSLEKALQRGVPDPGLDARTLGDAVEHMADAFGERVRTAP